MTREEAYNLMARHEKMMFQQNHQTSAGIEVIDIIFKEHEKQLKLLEVNSNKLDKTTDIDLLKELEFSLCF